MADNNMGKDHPLNEDASMLEHSEEVSSEAWHEGQAPVDDFADGSDQIEEAIDPIEDDPSEDQELDESMPRRGGGWLPVVATVFGVVFVCGMGYVQFGSRLFSQSQPASSLIVQEDVSATGASKQPDIPSVQALLPDGSLPANSGAALPSTSEMTNEPLTSVASLPPTNAPEAPKDAGVKEIPTVAPAPAVDQAPNAQVPAQANAPVPPLPAVQPPVKEAAVNAPAAAPTSGPAKDVLEDLLPKASVAANAPVPSAVPAVPAKAEAAKPMPAVAPVPPQPQAPVKAEVKPVAAPVPAPVAAPVPAQPSPELLAAQAKADALSARLDAVQKALDKTTDQLTQMTNTVANLQAAAVQPSGAAKAVAKDETVSPESLISAQEKTAEKKVVTKEKHKKVHVAKAEKKASRHAEKASTKKGPTLVLRGATPDAAWVSKSADAAELRQVAVGDKVPGLGKVVAIRQLVGGAWEVVGTQGSAR